MVYKIPNKKRKRKVLCEGENCQEIVEGKYYCGTKRLCRRCFYVSKEKHIKNWRKSK